jgi:hypothetical protein
MDLDARLEIYLASGYRIQTVLFNEALELMNTVMEDDGELESGWKLHTGYI